MKNIIHWCKPKQMWTSHTYKACTKSPIILIDGNWKTETRPEKKANPKGWIVTDHNSVIINPDESIIHKFQKTDELFYDKQDISFSHTAGKHLLFDGKRCFLVKKIEEKIKK